MAKDAIDDLIEEEDRDDHPVCGWCGHPDDGDCFCCNYDDTAYLEGDHGV